MSQHKPIRILIVEDHPVVREGLSQLIATQADMCVAGTASDGIEGIARFAELQPDVTLLDMRLPKLSGLEVLSHLRHAAPHSCVIAMSSVQDKQTPALYAGANAFLLKERFGDELLTTIRLVLARRAETITPNQS